MTLRPWFVKLGFDESVVAYAEDQAAGRAHIADAAPAIVIMRVPCGEVECLSWARIRREAKAANINARCVALVSDAECRGMADVVLPWPPDEEEFAEAMQEALWVFAVSSRNGWRGGIPGTEEASGESEQAQA